MARPPLEVADLIRAAGRSFIDRNRSWLNRLHLKVLTAIERCRTSALGGHLDACTQCGYTAISFNSCRDRHCPRCQSNARDRWIDVRSRELLPTPYVHVVFTLPHELAPLALQNKKIVYDLMTLHVNEFLRRFLLHVLPKGFVRIRHFGFLATRNRSKLLPICHHLLRTPARDSGTQAVANPEQAGSATWQCPHCAGPMVILGRLTAAQILLRSPPILEGDTA